MKIKLTPDLSYLIGAWKFRRTREGIGVYGSSALRSSFVAVALKTGFASPEKTQPKFDRVYFFHTALRAFMQATLRRQDDAFCHQNEYAASFFAGEFDAVGYVEKGMAILQRMDKRDEMTLLKLGYKVIKRNDVFLVGPADQFLKFIKSARRLEDSELERLEARIRYADRRGGAGAPRAEGAEEGAAGTQVAYSLGGDEDMDAGIEEEAEARAKLEGMERKEEAP